MAESVDMAKEEPPGRAAGSAWQFSLKAAMATLGGGLLTLCVTMAQITYQQYLEVLQRQGEQGAQFQAELFRASGHIENEMIDIFDRLTEDIDAPVEPDIHARLDALSDQWRLARLSFRVRGAQIYGHRVGNLVYDPGEEVIGLDGCSVEVRPGDPRANRNCPARRHAEGVRLGRLAARLRAEVAENGIATWSPAGFQTNFRLARTALHNYVDCRIAAAGGLPARGRQCDNLPDSLEILARRIDLMVLAREALSTRIMQSSALRD